MEKDVIKSYIRYLKLQRNMSGNTLDAYQRDLQKLLDYLEHESDPGTGKSKDLREVELEDLQHFAAGRGAAASEAPAFVQSSILIASLQHRYPM